MPLPHITLKRHLAVDLELMHVELFTEQVFHWFDHAWMTRELSEGLAIHVCGKVGAHRVAVFFPNVVCFAPAVQFWHCSI